MKTPKFYFALACVVAFSASCFAQNASADAPTTPLPNQKATGILGYLDPKTGAFRPVTHGMNPAEIPPATTPTTGKLVFNITIDVNSGLSTSAKISCAATVSVTDTTSLAQFENFAGAAATRSGTTATCSISIPYGWYLASASKDAVAIGVTVTSDVGSLGTPPYSIGNSSQDLEIPVPANGATTTETITTSI